MSDNLRDRIAAAIDQKYSEEAIGHTYEVCVHAADAVIRELGDVLKTSKNQYCTRCGRPHSAGECKR